MKIEIEINPKDERYCGKCCKCREARLFREMPEEQAGELWVRSLACRDAARDVVGQKTALKHMTKLMEQLVSAVQRMTTAGRAIQPEVKTTLSAGYWQSSMESKTALGDWKEFWDAERKLKAKSV